MGTRRALPALFAGWGVLALAFWCIERGRTILGGAAILGACLVAGIGGYLSEKGG